MRAGGCGPVTSVQRAPSQVQVSANRRRAASRFSATVSSPNRTRLPPNRKTREAPSPATAGNVRGGGPLAARRCQSLPSHPHVSPTTALSVAPPKSSATRPSYANPCALRTPGLSSSASGPTAGAAARIAPHNSAGGADCRPQPRRTHGASPRAGGEKVSPNGYADRRHPVPRIRVQFMTCGPRPRVRARPSIPAARVRTPRRAQRRE